jgi:hypothetical protein
MTFSNGSAPRIGLLELPGVGLVDQNGQNWNLFYNGRTLVSKYFLIPQLQAGGFDTELVNLKAGTHEEPYGEVEWNNGTLTKVLRGTKITDIDPDAYDVWGITVNFMVEREAGCMATEYLTRHGKPVVVGGSDPFAVPEPYFKAGAKAVIQDKSGAANWAILDYVLGKTPREKLTGVLLANGKQYPKRRPPMSPQEWPIPSKEVIKQCLGTQYILEGLPEERLPIGALYPDIGCDRKCDFCQTPTYSVGYKKMSVERIHQWAAATKEAGANSIGIWSDQFLARINWPTGRDEIIAIMRGLREIGVPYFWANGIELRKTTLGRGFRNSDVTPDEELIQELWGWDGEVGCCQAYIPAERPFVGRENYAKLLPWQEHCELMRTIVRAGVPLMNYGVIIGLPDDDHEGLSQLEEALWELYHDLTTINPELVFNISPFPIVSIPSTPLAANIRNSGLLRFEDPTLIGCFRISTADTKHMSYAEVSDWYTRIKKISNTSQVLKPKWCL